MMIDDNPHREGRLTEHELGGRAAGGIFWTGLSNVAGILLFLGTLVVLSRHLTPAEIGIMTMAEMVLGFMKMMNYLGCEHALIQRKELDEGELSAGFLLSAFVGLLFSVVLYRLTPLITYFFHEGELDSPVRLAALAVFFGGFSVIPRAVLQREMRFRHLAIIETTALALWSGVAVTLVLMGYGVRGVVVGWIVMRAIESLLFYFLSGWRFSLPVSWNGFREMLPFSLNLTGQNAVNFITSNIDYILIGRLLDAAMLGYYTMAYRMVTIPHTRISPIINRVTYPLFCALQEKNESLRRMYLLTISLISMVAFPMVTGLVILAPEVIRLLYGATWLPAAAPLRFLVMVGLLKAVGSTAGSVLLSKGRADIGLRINLALLLCLGVGLAWSSRWEVKGIAIAYSAILVIVFPIVQRMIGRLIDLGLADILRSLLPAASGSVIMGACIIVLRPLFRHRLYLLGGYLSLAGVIIAGVVIYIAFVRLVYPDRFYRIVRLIRTMLARAGE